MQSLRNETEPSRMQTVSAVQMLRPARNGNERARTEVDFGAINLPAGRTIYDYVAIILLFIMFVHYAIHHWSIIRAMQTRLLERWNVGVLVSERD